MKWLSNKEKPKHLRSREATIKSFFGLNDQLAKLVVCFAGIGFILSGDSSQFRIKTLASSSPQLRLQQIDKIAQKITVKILAEEFLGSGAILNRQNSAYTVVTNQHVLRAGKPPYQIQTPDGRTHIANVVKTINFKNYDLAILEFRSEVNYEIARLRNSAQLAVGDEVFAAGFPYSLEEPTPEQVEKLLFELKVGRVSVVLNKALEEGYQIGYTNDVKKGMSGGPLLNARGEVIGVNGKHAYPLWEAPDFYEDGSQPCPPLQDLITRSSLAIPIEQVVSLVVGISLSPPSHSAETQVEAVTSPIVAAPNDEAVEAEISRLQAEAEATKNCKYH